MFGSVALYFIYDSSESDSEETSIQQQPVLAKTNHTTQNSQRNLRRLQDAAPFNNSIISLSQRNLRDASNFLELPHEEFITTFRVNKQIFSFLLDEITSKLKPTYRSTHTPAAIKLAMFLAFVATGGQKKSSGNEIASGFCQSQVSKVITEILDIFEEHLYSKWVKLELSQEEENLIKEHFYKSFGIPGVVGCVENTHIQIKTPDREVKNLYKNRKGAYSLNVLMISDQNMVIKYVDATQPGSHNDAHVWNQSSANNYFRTNYLAGKENTWVLGDTTYNQQPYLMTPYKNPIEPHQLLFNEKHIQIRNTIKRCLSIMKNRFPCLVISKGLQYTPDKAKKIVISCCILHNICITYKNDWVPSKNAFENNDDDDETNETLNNEFSEFAPIRDEIAMTLSQWVGPKETSDINRVHLRHLRDATNVLELPKEQFIRSFRISKEVFSVLLEEIVPKLKVTYRSTHLPPSFKLATFLAFIATGGHTLSDGNTYTSKSLNSKTISELLDIFEEHLFPKWVKLDQKLEIENVAKEHFYNKSGIPGIVGCVDNTQIRIKTPVKEVRHLYKNRKGFSSLNIMIICDHNMVITYANASQPGSYHNSYTWDQSSADHYFRSNYLNGKENTWVLGDLDYKLMPYVMTPYRNPTEPYQKLFNKNHMETRAITRHCFKTLKNRFSCLNTPTGLQYIPEKAIKIVIACCIVHNVCIAYKNQWQPPNNTFNDVDSEDDDVDDDNGIFETFYEECLQSSFIRDEIARNLYCLKTKYVP